MALRLKKDVQKASYYVWFLGAQEARGLRGSRVLLPAIPRLVERSTEQEPLKVTLQVSHKGLKIIQGSSKHFIPHSAITCSVQTEDIVACVLLLYNPATRCPLHVHAYRCDSEATAEALNEQLQILINRPENQKRFADLESRLGLDAAAAAAAAQAVHSERSPDSSSNRQRLPSKTRPTSPGGHNNKAAINLDSSGSPVGHGPVTRMLSRGRFDVGSDTGTSTRESDCGSDEQQHGNRHDQQSPVMDGMKANLFDDLAAELREKLNGNGPPLLLPPRDYDTVHRSKGNLAASELRRCQNQMIVGAGVKGSKQTIVSSRGSSGIGSSDMAPSPERHDGQTSSDEDWTNDHQESEIVMQPPIKRAPVKEIALHKPMAQQPTQYLYPREPPRNEKFTDDEARGHSQRQSYRATPVMIQPQQPNHPTKIEANSRRSSVTSREEEEVRPILTKTRPNYNPQRFREIFRAEEEHQAVTKPSRFIEEELEEEPLKRTAVRRMHSRDIKSEEAPIKFEKHFPRPMLIERPTRQEESFSAISRDTEVDKHQFTRSASKDRMSAHSKPITRESKYKSDYYDEESKITESDRGTTSSLEKFMMRQANGAVAAKPKQTQQTHYKEPPVAHHEKEVTYRTGNDEFYFERNPYREPESQPYRESIEKMLKSPVMRYNSFDEAPSYVEEEQQRRTSSTRSRPSFEYAPSRRYAGESPVRVGRTEEVMGEMSKLKVSPQDRFRDAKEKFQQMEKVRGPPVEPPVQYPPPPPTNHSSGAMGRHPHDSMPPHPGNQMHKGQMMGGGGMLMKRDSNERMSGNMNSLHRTRIASNGAAINQQPPVMRRRGPEWSSEEDTERDAMMREMHAGPRRGQNYRDQMAPPPERYPTDNGRMLPAKSLGNLVKGYRHSYAEPQPHNMLSRSSGRVGLAAVNPY